MNFLLKEKGYLMFLVALAGAAFSLYSVLSQDRFLRGADAYYYAVQSKYEATTGKVRIPDSSFIHRLTGSLQKTGLSTEQSIRLWRVASLFFSALSLLILAVLSRRSTGMIPFIVLFWWVLSPSILFTAIEFPKIFGWLMWVPLWFFPLVGGRRKWGFSILLALASCFLHRAGWPIAVLFSAAVFVVYSRDGLPISWKKIVVFFAVLLLAVVVYFLALQDRLHLFDLGRISWRQLNAGWASLLRRENLPLSAKLDVVLAPLFFLFVTVRFWRTPGIRRSEILLPCALILPAIIPVGSEEVFNAGERYAILIPALLLTGSLFLSTRLEEKRHEGLGLKVLFVAACLAIPFLSSIRLKISHPLNLDPDFQAYDQVVNDLKGFDIPMLIAQKNLVYFYDYKLMREAFPYEPEDHWNKERVWRVLYKIFPEELNYYLEERCKWEGGLLKSLTNPDYQLIREDCWESMRSKITFDENSDLYHRAWETWLNPSKKRPLFLYPKHGGGEGEFSAMPSKEIQNPKH
jgi:hypothetical protein